MPAHGVFEEVALTTTGSSCANGTKTQVQENVVISGVSGRFPESDNMEEFRQHLLNGEDMVTEDRRRWTPGLHGLPKRSGKLKDISKFDATFFGVHPKQANGMDPQLRMLLEVTYEAIVDAGLNPATVKGSKTGVFIGCSASESHEAWCSDLENIVGYEMTGCTRSMFANRLSYFFDFKGPSFAIDTACSSSLLAMDQALQSIRTGTCDAAVVGGCSLCLKPSTTLQFQKLGMLAPDGSCKSFDASGNGYCRSEAVVAIYLQKEKTAKRIYATLVHSKNNSDGGKEQGITFPSGEIQKKLLLEVYNEANIDPKQVVYVEAHGTGTKAGDPQELNSIVDVFCRQDRAEPLLIGSTKSNMGHPEPASGLAAVAKVLVAMEEGAIPANLHYKSPNTDIPGLLDGRLSVVAEKTNWNGGYVGINSFGFGGSNVHAVLKSNPTTKSVSSNAAKHPRLFTFSARTQEGLNTVLDLVQKERSEDIEMQALLQELSDTSCTSHPYRGYAILNQEGNVRDAQKAGSDGRPVWFVFAGMGTQWHGMGRDLMELKVFKQSIMRSDAVLQQHSLQLYDLLMNGDERTFNETLNSFVGIAAIQVALVDVLKSFGIYPDGIVGHSVGELGCAYADGGLTAEETVLAAYWRGRCVLEADLPPGGMAAVGLTWAEAKARCPEGVVPACHNSVDTVTISGPAELVKQFVAELKEEEIFAKEVQSAGVAFHSYFMAKTAPALKAALQNVIKESRPRTKRWISSSIPEAKWDSNLAKYSSPDYHVNNLVSPVLFQEALQHVPKDAIAIEIAPHCLLQAILKRSLSTDCTFVGLMKRNHPNNLEFLFSSLGKCYIAGLNFNPLKIYNKVTFPVSRGTPMISPLVQWDHSHNWDVPKLEQFSAGGSGSRSDFSFEIDASPESKDHYLVGHMIDGRVLYPATGYLVLAWRALAKLEGQVFDQMPVSFENVHIHRATILPKTGTVKLNVSIMPGTGDFEVCENGALVVSGRISVASEPVLQIPPCEKICNSSDSMRLKTLDVYKELRLRGYDYGPTFQGILDTNHAGDEGHLLWNDNWVSYLDTMLQIQVLSLPGRGLRLPTRMKALRIDPTLHNDKAVEFQGVKAMTVTVDRDLDVCQSGAVEILGLHATVAPRRQQAQTPPTLEHFNFVPYSQHGVSHTNLKLKSYTQSILAFTKTSLESMFNSCVEDSVPNTQLFRQVLNEKSSDNFDADKYPESDSHQLIDMLREIFNQEYNDQFFANATNIRKTFQDRLKNDILLGNIFNPKILKPCLDVVLENSKSITKIKIVELYTGAEFPLHSKVIPLLNSQPMLNIDYTIAGTNLDSLNQDEIEGLDVKTVAYDFLKSSVSPPSQLNSVDLIILNNVLHKKRDIPELLQNLQSLLKSGGFLLVTEPTTNHAITLMVEGIHSDLGEFTGRSFGPFFTEDEVKKQVSSNGLQVIREISDGLLSSMYLVRKPAEGTLHPVVINIDDLTFDWVDAIKTAMTAHQEAAIGHTIWLMSENLPESGIIGMINCLKQEPGGDRIRCIFNTSLKKDAKFPTICLESPTFQTLLKQDLVMNVYRDGQWGSFRHLPLKQEKTEINKSSGHAYVNVITRGDLSSLKWIESPLKYFRPEDNPEKDLCSVYYTSLNFRDIMLATGKLPPDAIPGNMATQDCILGMEFSGRNSQGHKVMGLLPAKGLATTVDADRRFLWEVPETWTLEEAASIPVVYTTVYYALVVRGRIKRGDKVLIHSGSGGVGQAAISVALHHGCKVFTTVGSKQKREYLKQRFPQLTDNCFSNSRDTSFEWDILRATKGKGVDVVLNSLAEEKLQASLRCLAQHGRFLEIGKFDLSNNTPLGMAIFLRNISFHGILLDALFEEGNAEWSTVSDLLADGIKQGAVKPLKTTVFDKEDVEGAFRFMAQGKHIGKVLVKVREEETDEICKASPVILPSIPRTSCDPHKSYIITGGLGGFGLELAHWLVDRGARFLVLTSRSGVRNGYQARCIRVWRDMGVRVLVATHNVKFMQQTEELISEANTMAPVGGIFHLAMVLRDGLMENQTKEQFQQVADPKVAGTFHLDHVSRQQCADSLDWFVVFSSVSCGRGNAGQANYGFANSLMERICEKRKHDGFPGLAIQWGAIGDVGVVLDTMGNNDTVVGGTLPQRITSCLSSLDTFLNQEHPVCSSFVLAEKKNKVKTDQSKGDLVQAVAHVLGLKDVSNMNPDTSLADLGLDSLMGVEVKQTLERDYDLVLPMTEIRKLTFSKLREVANNETSSPNSTESRPPRETSPRPDDQLSSTAAARYDFTQIMPQKCLVKLNEVTEGDPLYIVHPIEGCVKCLKEMAALTQRPTYGLQCTVDAPITSVSEMASYYIKIIKEALPTGPYHIAGYSFGACIAFEMCLQLESAGDPVGSIGLLDGSHSYVAAHTGHYKSKLTPGDTAREESEALCAFTLQFTAVDYVKLLEELLALPNLTDRISLVVDKHLMPLGSFTDRKQVCIAAESFYRKLVIADKYEPSAKLRRNVTLIKAANGTSEQPQSLGDDYGLSEVVNGDVTVHSVKGDHETFLQGQSAQEIADILSR